MAHVSRTTTNFKWHFPLPNSGIIFFLNAILLLWSVTLAKTLTPILWDKNNSNFTGPGLNITVEINDLIDIVCPQTENTTEGRLKAQYQKFTQVSQQGYQICSIQAGRKRNLLSCNRPFNENKLTLLFQEYTPYPGGATFSHGREYYFITTSDGTPEGIDNESGGLCQTNNMKLIVNIKQRPTATPTTVNPNASTARTSSTTTTESAPRITRRLTTQRRMTTRPKTTTAASTTRATTVLTTTAKATTKEQNKISDSRGGSAASRTSLSAVLLLVTWLVAVVRWFDL